MIAWALLWTLASASAPSAQPPPTLARCDAAVFDLPAADRDYGCYNRAAFADAKAVVEHLRTQLETHGDDGRLWLTYGSIAGDQGEDAEEAFRIAIEKMRAAGQDKYLVQAQLNLSRRLQIEDRDAEAARLIEDAAAISTRIEHPLLIAIVRFERLGLLARTLDADVLEAIALAEASYDSLDDATPYQVRRNGARTLARGYGALGSLHVSARWSDEAQRVSAAVGDHASALRASQTAARARYRADLHRHDTHATLRFHERTTAALAEAIETNNPWAELTARLDLASSSPPASSKTLWQNALDAATKLEAVGSQQRSRAGLAVAMALEDPGRALALSDDVLRTVRADPTAAGTVFAHATRAEVALTQRDIGGAWSSWQTMLDTLEREELAQDDAAGRAAMRASELARYRLVAGSILRYGPPNSRWDRRAFDAMERMRGRELTRFSRRARLQDTSTGTRAELDQVRDALPLDTAMFMYSIGDERVHGPTVLGGAWLLVITHDDVRRHPLPAARLLDPAAAMTAGSFTHASSSGAVAQQSLFEMILEQPLAELSPEIHNLVIVPDAQLHRVPLGALGLANEPPVFSRYAISTASSATSWLDARPSEPIARRLVALADPSLETSNGSDVRRDVPRLRGARAESSFIAAVFDPDARVLLDDAATEAALVSTPPGGLLHLAAHVIVDHLEPSRSRLLLASGAGQDGAVFLDELAALDLRGTVVVLAACQGADGELLGGEGVVSPARALFAAGADAVVASLWPVDDQEAALFFAAFYEALDEAQPLAQALSTAQAQRRAAGAPMHAWAGYVVLGDGAIHVEPRSRLGVWIWALLAAFIAGAGTWLLRRRNTRRLR